MKKLKSSPIVMRDCRACALYKTRRNIVVGRGNVPAKIMFIGEAPGKTEDAIGLPFYGPSGKLLDAMLIEAGVSCSYYISNTVLCHPTDKLGGENREPTKLEVLSCRMNLQKIIEQVRPEVYIFVGKVAERFYKDFVHPNYTILHPSFLLRSGGKNSPYYKQTILKLKEIISINERGKDF